MADNGSAGRLDRLADLPSLTVDAGEKERSRKSGGAHCNERSPE
jgi:hypothetical protein